MKLKALIVDDDSMMRHLLMQLLPHTGLAEFRFTEAQDGLEALEKFSVKHTDILFVDWNMPKMTVIDLVRRIRASGKTEHILIVMVTGETHMGKVAEALDSAGVDIYVTKPFTIDDLRRLYAKPIQRIADEKSEPAASKPGSFLGRLIGSRW